MKKLFSFLSAAALVLMAGSCVKEQLTTFDSTEADAPVLADGYTLLPDATDPKSVVLNYTPAVFHRSFNTKMPGYHSLVLTAVDGKNVDKTLGAAFDEQAGTVTISLSALSKVLMGLGYAKGAQPSVDLALRASIQPTVYDSSVLSYVQSTNTVTVSGFSVSAPAGSPYTEYTLGSDWSVIGTLSAYGINWDGDLEMWSSADESKHVAKAVTLKEGDEFKFRKEQAWTDNFGGSFGSLDASFDAVAGGDNIKVGADGVYDLWLDSEAGTITVTEAYLPYPSYTQASDWSVIGALSAYGMSWDGDLAMYTDGTSHLAMNITVADGDEFKFRKDKAWTDNFGGTFGSLDAEFEAVAGGDNIKVGAGSYDMFLDPDAKTIRIVESLGAGISGILGAGEEPSGGDEPVEEIIDEAWAVIGAVNGTNWNKDFYMTEAGGVWTSPVLSFEEGGEFKLRFDNTWFYDDCIVGASEQGLVISVGTPVTGIQPGGNFKVAEAGDYRIVFKESSLEVTLVSMANQYSLIGSVNGSSWDKDFYLTEGADGTWTSGEVAIAGEFKIRFNKSWADADVFGLADGAQTRLNEAMTAAQPGGNFRLDEGKYTIMFIPATKSVTVIPSKPANMWSVIGAVNGTSWSEDFYMSEVLPGIWVSDEILDLTGEWKIRFDNGWAVNRGGAALSAPGEFGEATQDGGNLTLVTKTKVVYNAHNETLGTLGWGVVGSIAAIDGFSWNADVPMNLAADGKWYSLPITLGESDEVKIRWMAAWDQDFGGNCTAIDAEFDAAAGGSNIKAPAAGTYVLIYDPTAGKLTLSTEFWGMVGAFNSWNGDVFLLPVGNSKWAAYNQAISGEWKIRRAAGWDADFGGTFTTAGEAFDAVAGGPNITAGDLGSFDVLLDTAAAKITLTGN